MSPEAEAKLEEAEATLYENHACKLFDSAFQFYSILGIQYKCEGSCRNHGPLRGRL